MPGTGTSPSSWASRRGGEMPFMRSSTRLLPFVLSLSVCFLILATSEVHKSFQNCLQFFLDKKPPDVVLPGRKLAPICQVYKKAYRFATLYDREKRIPIYSVYTYRPGSGGRSNDWFVEPQLANPSFRRSMEDERSEGIVKIFEQIKASQAVSADYEDAYMIDKGHLNPNGHQPDADSRSATFTLTNIVPQHRALNQGKWAKYEASVVQQRARGCNETYIITGVVPGNTTISNRVNKPSHIWSAACCVTDNNRRRSWAAIAKNDENNTANKTLRRLERILTKYYKKPIDLFHGSCYSSKEAKTLPYSQEKQKTEMLL